MRRKTLLTVILVCLALVGVVVALWWWKSEPSHQINSESFRKIEKGMTENEVETLLGGPYGQYFDGEATGLMPGFKSGPLMFHGYRLTNTDLCSAITMNPVCVRKAWIGNGLGIWIWFDDKGLVIRKDSYEVRRHGFFDELQDMFTR